MEFHVRRLERNPIDKSNPTASVAKACFDFDIMGPDMNHPDFCRQYIHAVQKICFGTLQIGVDQIDVAQAFDCLFDRQGRHIDLPAPVV